MTHESLLDELWGVALDRLGGAVRIEASARETGAFSRPREGKPAVDLLRLVLAYCLGGMGLRTASAWAASVGLAGLSNVALLGRLRNCGDWLEHLVGELLGAGALPAAHGRLVRILDATPAFGGAGYAGSNGASLEWFVASPLRLRSSRRTVQLRRIDG